MKFTLPTVQTVPYPQGWGYDGYIDELLLRFAVSPDTILRRQTAEPTPQRIDTAESAEDIRDETGFRYSRSILSGGAGLDFLHDVDRPADASTRFWSSRGLDVFGDHPGEPYAARLMKECTLEQASAASKVHVVDVGDDVFWTDGSNFYAVGSGTSLLALTNTHVVSMGNNIYALDATGSVIQISPAWSTTQISAPASTYTDMWAVKSRILAVDGNELYETDPTTPILILTLPDDDTVTDVVDADEFVLVFSTSGSIYTLTLDDSLALIVVAESPLEGETPRHGAYAQSVLGYATTETVEAGGTILRFYSAALSDSGVPIDKQLVYQVGDTETTTTYDADFMYATRDSIYLATQSDLDTDMQQLWRFYLPTMGYARDLEIDSTGLPVESIAEAADRLWLSVNTKGIYKEQDTYVSSGYFIGPAADFSSSDLKQWIESYLRMSVIPAGTQAELYESVDIEDLTKPDSLSWEISTTLRFGATERTNQFNAIADSRYHLAKVILRSSSGGAETPQFNSYSFRALPNPNRDRLYLIPVNASDQYESPGRRAQRIPGRGQAIYDALLRYEGESVTFGIYSMNLQVVGVVERIEATAKTFPDRGSVPEVVNLHIRGKQRTANQGYGTTTSGYGFAIDTFGISMFAKGADDV